MDSLLKTTLFLLLLVVVVFSYCRWTKNYRKKPLYPRGSRKHVADAYQEQSAPAKLLAEILTLKAKNAQWPEILGVLNPQNDPHIRTVLLEIRGPHIFVPHTALNIIESVCVAAKRPSTGLSRLELLEAAKASMDKVVQYGN